MLRGPPINRISKCPAGRLCAQVWRRLRGVLRAQRARGSAVPLQSVASDGFSMYVTHSALRPGNVLQDDAASSNPTCCRRAFRAWRPCVERCILRVATKVLPQENLDAGGVDRGSHGFTCGGAASGTVAALELLHGFVCLDYFGAMACHLGSTCVARYRLDGVVERSGRGPVARHSRVACDAWRTGA